MGAPLLVLLDLLKSMTNTIMTTKNTIDIASSTTAMLTVPSAVIPACNVR